MAWSTLSRTRREQGHRAAPMGPGRRGHPHSCPWQDHRPAWCQKPLPWHRPLPADTRQSDVGSPSSGSALPRTESRGGRWPPRPRHSGPGTGPGGQSSSKEWAEGSVRHPTPAPHPLIPPPPRTPPHTCPHTLCPGGSYLRPHLSGEGGGCPEVRQVWAGAPRQEGGGGRREAGTQKLGVLAELGTQWVWEKFPAASICGPQHPLTTPESSKSQCPGLLLQIGVCGVPSSHVPGTHTHGLWQGGPVTLPAGSNKGVPRPEGRAGRGQGAGCTGDCGTSLSKPGTPDEAWRSSAWPGLSHVTRRRGAVVPNQAPSASKRGSCRQGQEAAPGTCSSVLRRLLKASF